MYVALDTETKLITDAEPIPAMVCLSICSEEGDPTLHHVTESEPILRRLLGFKDLTIVGHNVAFDMAVILRQWPTLTPLVWEAYDTNRVVDTGIRQMLIDNAAGELGGFYSHDGERKKISYRLDDLSVRLFDAKLDKDTWRLRYGELIDVPLPWWPQGAKDYALTDAKTTIDVFKAQELAAPYLEDQYRQTRAAWWLWLMQNHGIRTSRQAIDAFEASITEEYNTLRADLESWGWVATKGDGTPKKNMKVIQQYVDTHFPDCKRNKPTKAFPQGAPSLSHEILDALPSEHLHAFTRFNTLSKSFSTDIHLLREGERFPIRARFVPILDTGRTSCRKPNLQNVKRSPGLRECFVPREGCSFIAADYPGLELRTMAQACLALIGQSALAKAINQGLDAHLMMASHMAGLTYEAAAKLKAEGDERIDSLRQTGKVCNFGFPGGMGARALVEYAAKGYDVHLTEAEAKDLKGIWLQAWPEFRDYFNHIGQLTGRGNATIRQLYTGRVRGGCRFTQACNTFFQGLGADATKAAGYLIARACYYQVRSPLFGCRLVNYIHDEFILECPLGREHEAAWELARLMVEGVRPFIPNVCPKVEEIEPLAMSCWSKKAKPVLDENGRLIPWQST